MWEGASVTETDLIVLRRTTVSSPYLCKATDVSKRDQVQDDGRAFIPQNRGMPSAPGRGRGSRCQGLRAHPALYTTLVDIAEEAAGKEFARSVCWWDQMLESFLLTDASLAWFR